MSQADLLKQVVGVLASTGVDYMVTGSVVSSMQGEPRSSHDVDLVVALPSSSVKPLVAAFPAPDFFLSEQAILDAIRGRSMFNLLALNTGDKVDFWMLTDEPFDRSRFARKRVEVFMGTPLKVSTPEDTILAKLRWCKLSGGSERQFTDALRVYELQRETLDSAYLNDWAARLGVQDLWEQIKIQADAPPDN
jgi:hypothetical protein